MRLLQILMTFVLSLCLTWGSAILFGPYLIERLIDRQSNGSVKVNKLEVSPNLTVMAGGLAVFEADRKIFELRGVSLDWSIMAEFKPSVTLRSVKGVLNSQAIIDNLEVRFSELKPGQSLQLNGRVTNISVPAYGDAQDVVFDAEADWNLQSFDRVRVSSGHLASVDPYAIDLKATTLELNRLRSDRPLSEQELVGGLHLIQPSLDSGDLSAPAAQINFVSNKKRLTLNFESETLLSPMNDLEVLSVSGSLKVTPTKPSLYDTFNINIEGLNWRGLNIPDATAEVNFNGAGYGIEGGGQLEVNEIDIGGRYIGWLPRTQFNLATVLREEAGNWAVSGEARASIDEEPIFLEATIKARVAADAGIESCIFANCKLNDLFAVYELQAGGAALYGESRCVSLVCADGASEHVLETSDTNKFFAEIQASNLVNPIILAVAYAQMLAGEQKGSGHRLKF